MSDAEIAGIGRNLAQALMRAAYERDPESKRQVLVLHTELCSAFRREQTEPPPTPEAKS